MRRVRVIPSLLLQRSGLVKTKKFKSPIYVGDPINAVKIFNEKEVDELAILDIDSRKNGQPPNLSRIKDIVSEAFMPIGYGGNITTLDQVKELINSGVEKIILNTSAYNSEKLVTEAARYVGSQSVVVSIDVKKNLFGTYKVYVESGQKNTNEEPGTFAHRMAAAGAGEILLTSIDRDGTFEGFDINLIQRVSQAVDIPVVASGGAASINDFLLAIESGASAVAAGSLFVFQGPHRAVLISYPSQEELKGKLFSKLE